MARKVKLPPKARKYQEVPEQIQNRIIPKTRQAVVKRRDNLHTKKVTIRVRLKAKADRKDNILQNPHVCNKLHTLHKKIIMALKAKVNRKDQLKKKTKMLRAVEVWPIPISG